MKTDDILIELYKINDIEQLFEYIKSFYKFNFTLLTYDSDEFSYSNIFSTILEEKFFFDTEIKDSLPYELNEVTVYYQYKYEIDNTSFLLLIHDYSPLNEFQKKLFKHIAIAVQKLNLIKYYQNSLLANELQLDLIKEIGELLGNFDLEILLTKILENAVKLVNGDVGVICLKKSNILHEQISWGVPRGVLIKIINKNTNKPLVEEIFDNKEIVLIEDLSTHPEYEFLLKEKFNIKSFIGLPLYTKNKDLGVLILINFKIDIDSIEITKATLETLTQIAAIGIENAIFFKDSLDKEKLLTELKIAANLQKKFLPAENFSTEKFFIGGFSIPARSVGGDFYNYLISDDNKITAFVGDVSGKGVPAALLTTMAMSLLKTFILEFKNLQKVLYKINNIICREDLDEKYFTLGIFDIDLENHSVELINAGHTDIIHFDSQNEKINKYPSENLPIGMFEDVEFEVKKFNINKNDLIITFSDGLPDAINEEGERYELDRLINLIKKFSTYDPEKIKLEILNDITKFCGDVEQFDDLTLLIIKILQ